MPERRTPPAELGQSRPLAPPIYVSSVYALPDLDALDRIMEGIEAGFIYARDAHPNALQLAERLAELENGASAVMCASGMAAISSLLIALLRQGDRIVISDQLYGKSLQLFESHLNRFGIQTSFVDALDPAQVRASLAKPARILFVETLSNPMLRVADLETLANLAHEQDCLFVVDNTFATPILVRPLDHGADVVVESLTKLMGGHSDVTLGVVISRGTLAEQIAAIVSTWGFFASPFDCWLAARGLATLSLRMRAASNNARILADWLKEQAGVVRVIYPGLVEHPDHALAGRLFNGGFGSVLCFELVSGREAVNRFMRLAQRIPFSPSLGDTTTTCSHPALTSHRFMDPEVKRRLGIGDGLIRLSVGVEQVDQIKAELAKGLK